MSDDAPYAPPRAELEGRLPAALDAIHMAHLGHLRLVGLELAASAAVAGLGALSVVGLIVIVVLGAGEHDLFSRMALVGGLMLAQCLALLHLRSQLLHHSPSFSGGRLAAAAAALLLLPPLNFLILPPLLLLPHAAWTLYSARGQRCREALAAAEAPQALLEQSRLPRGGLVAFALATIFTAVWGLLLLGGLITFTMAASVPDLH